jgi:hypothetical protein
MSTDYDAYDAILHHIFREVRTLSPYTLPSLTLPQTQGDAWFKPLSENLAAGVCLRVADAPALPAVAPAPPSMDGEIPIIPLPAAKYRVFPYENMTLAPFEAAVRALNPVVAVKVRSAAVHAALATV